MSHRTPFPARKRQRGLALVEFAIVAPLVAFLMFATAEVGRGLYEFNALTKAVRDGARYMASHSDGTSGVLIISAGHVATARNLVVFGNPAGGGAPLLEGLGTGDVNVTVANNRYVRVDADYDFVPVFDPLPTFGLGGEPISIGPFTASATMRSLQ